MDKSNSFNRITIMLFGLILMTSFVSAFEFDNTYRYDPVTRIAVVENCALWVGTCLIKGDDLVTLTLTSPINKIVPIGEDILVGEFTLRTTDDFSDIVQALDLTNLKNGQVMIRGKQYKVKTYKDVLIDDYETVCSDGTYNITIGDYNQVCVEEEVGNHWETQMEWMPLKSGFEFIAWKVYEMGVFVDVEEVGERGDWKPQVMSQSIVEWASWEASYETNLISWLQMEDNTASVFVNDISGNSNNGTLPTNNTDVISTTGKVELGFDLGGTDYAQLDTGLVSTTFSRGVWFKTTADVTTTQYIYAFRFGNFDISQFYITGGALKHYTDGGSGETVIDGAISTNTWYHLVEIRNTTASNILINGGSVSNLTFTLDVTTAVNRIGTEHTGASIFEGIVDEFFLYDIAISPEQVEAFYNTGDGLTFNQTTEFPPIITLNSPPSTNYSTTQTLTINFTSSDAVNLSSVQLYVNGILNQTNASGINNTDYLFDVDLGEGTYVIKGIATNNQSITKNSSSIIIGIDTTPFIDFLTPPTLPNGTSTAQEYIPMKVNVTTSYFQNITYLLVNENTTEYTQFYGTEIYDINFTNQSDAHYDYNVTICTTTNKCNTTGTRHVNHDATPPNISGTYNLTDITTFTMPTTSKWHYNATDPAIDKCYYNTTENATKVVTCNSTITTQWTVAGNRSITYCANDTFSNENCSTEYIYISYIALTQAVDKNPAGEGQDVTWTLNVGLINSPSTTANFFLNDTWYSPNTTTATQNNTYFDFMLNIPDGWGNSTGINYVWHWNYTIDGLISSTNISSTNITVFDLALDDCASFTDIVLNMSLKDEGLFTLVNASAGSNVDVDVYVSGIDDPTVSLHYSNAFVNDNNPQVCMPSGLLNNSQYNIEFTIGYDSTDRVREFFYLDNGTLNSSSTFNSYTPRSLNLMDLLTTDSTTFLFEYTDENNQKVDDIIVHTFRYYIGEGLYREVERSKQDNSGQTHVHLVEEDVIYYFMITQYGEILFTSDSYNAKCLSTPCEISLSASPTGQNWSIIDNEGGKYNVVSDGDARTVTTSFSLDTSTLVNVSLYKMFNASGVPELVNTSSITSMAGSIELSIPLSYDNSTFFVSIYNDNEFVKSTWVSMEEGANIYFGTLGLLLGGFIVLTMMLMAITEGVGFIVTTILAIIIISVMQLVDLGWLAIISIICAGGVIMWKLVKRRGGK